MNSFPAKILLIGEYTAVLDQAALAIPLHNYSCHWVTDSTAVPKNTLGPYYDWLIQQNFTFLDLNRLRFDASQHDNYPTTTIPLGYGLGSSGALVASLYYRYQNGVVDNYEDLKKRLAIMEAYFHGQSSGLDPLVSFLNQAVLTHQKKVDSLPIAIDPRFFLLDSNQERQQSTASLVDQFLMQLEQPDFQKVVDTELLPANIKAIEAIIKNNPEDTWIALRQISTFQLNHMSTYIVENVLNLWKTGLESDHYALKLCGAGYGGMYLGLAKSIEYIPKEGIIIQ